MGAIDQIRAGYKTMHDFLEGTVADVTADQAHWSPPGSARPIGAQYAHVLFTEDGIVGGMLRGAAPLMATRFAGKTGASEPPPQGFNWGEWASSVKVDLPSLREYGNAVYAATDEYLATVSEADLAREVDMGPNGKYTVGALLNIVMGNAAWHTGEIACLKGLQGGKGYPV